jgi:hypothetical protein
MFFSSNRATMNGGGDFCIVWYSFWSCVERGGDEREVESETRGVTRKRWSVDSVARE